MSGEKFEVDKLEERIAPSTLAIGTILDHAVSGNSVASGNTVGVSVDPTVNASTGVNPIVGVNPSAMVSGILQNVANDLGSSGGGLLGL